MSRNKGQEKAVVQCAASAVKAEVKAKGIECKSQSTVVAELQEVIWALQREVHQLRTEKEERANALAKSLSEQPTFEDATASGVIEFDVDTLRAQNQALRAEVKRLSHQASSDTQNFAGAIASLNTELERVRAELAQTRGRAEAEILFARTMAAEGVRRAEELARADRAKLDRLLVSIGSLVEDIASS